MRCRHSTAAQRCQASGQFLPGNAVCSFRPGYQARGHGAPDSLIAQALPYVGRRFCVVRCEERSALTSPHLTKRLMRAGGYPLAPIGVSRLGVSNGKQERTTVRQGLWPALVRRCSHYPRDQVRRRPDRTSRAVWTRNHRGMAAHAGNLRQARRRVRRVRSAAVREMRARDRRSRIQVVGYGSRQSGAGGQGAAKAHRSRASVTSCCSRMRGICRHGE
ncbi:hypothetical protein EV667_1971 [Ancylobacter aquaticus]|uniref:Uncharacterized protein n=1 Tax=Ancylobacter aquaticus TaxID=100 RepID=A0A4R1I2X8_ANCAQ|nr:hypothetical protein EV667_1971 [Ancylobacter aquaticus]